MEKLDIFMGRTYVVIAAMTLAAKSADYAMDGAWWWWIIAIANVFMAFTMARDGVK